MSIYGRFTQQSTETLDCDIDFTDWFSNRADTASSFQVIVPTGLTSVASSMSGTIVKVSVTGGVSGTAYLVSVLLTTSSGIVKRVDFYVTIKDD